ncbi:MAG: hypothetical protein HYW27_01570 [Candidatus Aenigmarchaeota archaeon]|nr:hypothetical protein [Candidatus Aenigmarchaeota archaeon]
MDYLNEVEHLKPAVVEAADRFILPRFRNLEDGDVLNKGDFDKTVTAADMETSSFLLDSCRERFPGSFTEEDMDDRRFEHDTLWSIDPLDGTDEFRRGREGFGIQAALLERKNGGYFPAAGFLYLPVRKTFVYATQSEGPFVDDGHVIREIKVPISRNITGFQREIDISKELDEFYKFMRKKGYEVNSMNIGGACASVAQMLLGSPYPNLYICPRPYTKEWDTSPFENMIARAGGFISDLYGNQFTYNRHDVRNLNGFVICIGYEKGRVMSWIDEFGAENLLKAV